MRDCSPAANQYMGKKVGLLQSENSMVDVSRCAYPKAFQPHVFFMSLSVSVYQCVCMFVHFLHDCNVTGTLIIVSLAEFGYFI